MTRILDVRDVHKRYPLGRSFFGRPKTFHDALRGTSLTLDAGRTVAVVGESGAGKSTLGRLILGAERADSGTIELFGTDVTRASTKQWRALRRRGQMIFQDPFASLDPRMTVGDSVAEGLIIHERELDRAGRTTRVTELLDRVGLGPAYLPRYPHELSGGQLQRVSIARALGPQPDLIVCDEPVAALDVSIQAQVLNLLLDLQDQLGLGYVFISHDLSIVRRFAHEVVVMREGEVVESGPIEQVFTNPSDPYTEELIGAVLRPSATRTIPDIDAGSAADTEAEADKPVMST